MTNQQNLKFQELVSKLREIFQIDKPDLDFGIYRILNARADEINDYLQNRLYAKVQQALSQGSAAQAQQLQSELAKAEEGAKALGVSPDSVPKVLEIREKLKNYSVGSSEHENAVFSHLLTFFSRYYDKGDFISQRRYKGDTYAIPYAGEEVVLHWANKDQYYTKSGENFSNYSFKLPDENGEPGRTVHFRLVAADTAKDNRKDNDTNRCFALINERVVTHIDDEGDEYEEHLYPVEEIQNAQGEQELIIRFEYAAQPKSVKQAKLVEDAVAILLKDSAISSRWLALSNRAPTEAKPQRTLLEKYLTDYTEKNNADYFIHKDLGGFLNRELDFYIKNEVMHLDDVQEATAFADIEKSLRMIQCLRAIARELISFLAQLEDFQKKLWLKKKFVTETNYCITLDRVPETLYPQIIANEQQHDEWVKLFAIDEIKANDKTPAYSQPFTEAFLKANQNLVLDTQFFDNDFKAKLIGSIEGFDNQCDGLLVHSENFQALQLLQERYREQVKCIYIDPPYNKGYDGFIYKDKYQNSSWLSMAYDRISMKNIFLKKSGVISISIDDDQDAQLVNLLDHICGHENRLGHLVWDRNHSAQAGYYKIYHEYICNYAASKANLKISLTADGFIEAGAMKKPSKRHKLQEFAFPAGTNFNAQDGVELSGSWGDAEFVELISGRMVAENNKLKYPVILKAAWTQLGQMQKFFNGEIVFDTKGQRVLDFFFTSTGKLKYKKERNSEIPSSVIRFGTASQSTNALYEITGFEIDQTPKPVQLNEFFIKYYCDSSEMVFDYFAGSGTTGHAVINLNREDQGDRKYILVEQGEYFGTVLKPRLAKVAYSKDWKDGKPTARDTGISHCFKYIRLESYEDTLNNLQLKRNQQQSDLLTNLPEQAQEDYLLHYMLDVESRGSLLSVEDFKRPFDYHMNIATDSAGAYERKKIDLVETFNYLIGLQVKHTDAQIERGFVTVTGTLPSGESCLVLWRDCTVLDYEGITKLCNRLAINPADNEFDVVYLNGDHNIPTVLMPTEEEGGAMRVLKLRQIEPEFLERMFAVEDV